MTTRTPYSGCMRNIRIRKTDENITPSMIGGDVDAGICPTI